MEVSRIDLRSKTKKDGRMEKKNNGRKSSESRRKEVRIKVWNGPDDGQNLLLDGPEDSHPNMGEGWIWGTDDLMDRSSGGPEDGPSWFWGTTRF